MRRYCGPCDQWLTGRDVQRECPRCGADTDPEVTDPPRYRIEVREWDRFGWGWRWVQVADAAGSRATVNRAVRVGIPNGSGGIYNPGSVRIVREGVYGGRGVR